MSTPTDQQKIEAYHRIRNLIPSRERIEELRRMARGLEDKADRLRDSFDRGRWGNPAREGEVRDFEADADLLDFFADLLLDIRQAIHGGRKEVKGSRHWTEET